MVQELYLESRVVHGLWQFESDLSQIVAKCGRSRFCHGMMRADKQEVGCGGSDDDDAKTRGGGTITRNFFGDSQLIPILRATIHAGI